MPAVSILMNCFNGAAFLSEAVASVYSQTFRDWEIIFWDNQSTDESARIAHSYDEKLRYFYAPVHTSLGAARNQALQKVSGDYIAFLDCDDIWLPQKLDTQMTLFQRKPEVVVVYSDSHVINAEGVVTGTLFEKRKPHAGWVYAALLCNNFVPLLTAAVRRDAVDKAGGCSSHFHHAEDWDLFLRLAQLGPFDFVLQCLAQYRIHANSFHLRNWVLMTQEEIELLERHLPSIQNVSRPERKRIQRKLLTLHGKLVVKKLLREGLRSAVRGLWSSGFRYLHAARQIGG